MNSYMELGRKCVKNDKIIEITSVDKQGVVFRVAIFARILRASLTFFCASTTAESRARIWYQ